MLDLKAKLAAAGLVSEADVQRAEAEKRAKAERKQARGGNKPAAPPAGLPVAKLRGKNKGEIYDAVRRFVERVRLDPVGGAPSETARPFHFSEPSGRIGRLVIEPALATELEGGRAALVAFMSNHGLAHAVVPADDGRAIAELMPKWLRVLAGDARAGLIDKPEGEPDATPP